MLEPSEKLSTALRSVFPKIRIALMSSDPEVHSAEGRDWHGLQDAIGMEPAFLTRPHFPPYMDGRIINIFNPSDDPAVNPQLIVCGNSFSDSTIEYLNEQAQWERMDIHIEPYNSVSLITLNKTLDYLKNISIRIF